MWVTSRTHRYSEYSWRCTCLTVLGHLLVTSISNYLCLFQPIRARNEGHVACAADGVELQGAAECFEQRRLEQEPLPGKGLWGTRTSLEAGLLLDDPPVNHTHTYTQSPPNYPGGCGSRHDNNKSVLSDSSSCSVTCSDTNGIVPSLSLLLLSHRKEARTGTRPMTTPPYHWWRRVMVRHRARVWYKVL